MGELTIILWVYYITGGYYHFLLHNAVQMFIFMFASISGQISWRERSHFINTNLLPAAPSIVPCTWQEFHKYL